MYRKVHEMQMRAQRDKKKAEELKQKAVKQIKDAVALMEAARWRVGKNAVNTQAILDIGKKAIEEARDTIAKADVEIKSAAERVKLAAAACKNIRGKNPVAISSEGLTVPFWRKGKVEVQRVGETDLIPFDFDHDMIVPGDRIFTGKDGSMGVASVLSKGQSITMGHETSMNLISDDAKGTVWWMGQGQIHITPMIDAKSKTKLQIRTADAVYECDESCQFDVNVDKNGESHMVVYAGNPRQYRRTERFAPSGQQSAPKWWEELIKEK
ncbi:MAG: hypothetical protein PHT32_04175 [Candidatus Omnitrophica bacterium]|nr:hypothetical protein [Candidatus Omnitrophota bacterium]